jgi:hypothetical protein
MSIEFSRPDQEDIAEAVAFTSGMWAVLVGATVAILWSSLGTLIIAEVFANTLLMSDTMAARAVFWSLQMPVIGVLSYLPLWVMGLFKGEPRAYTHLSLNVFGAVGVVTFVVSVVLGWGPMPV